MHPAQIRAGAELERLLGVKPFDHQAQAAAVGMSRFEEFQAFSLLHGVGCGKTLTVLGLFGMLFERGWADSMLVVCPSSVISSWEKESLRCRFPVEVLPLTGACAKREAVLQRKLLERASLRDVDRLPLLVVTNFEAIHRMEAVLRAARFGVVVADEAQRIKAPGSKVSRAMHRVGRSAGFRVVMSGTPASEGALGYYGIYRFLDDRIFGTSFVSFKARYAVEVDLGSFRKVVAMRDMDDLERRVMGVAHRVSKEEAVTLPEELVTTRVFDLSPKERRVYDGLARESIAVLEDEFGESGVVVANNVLARILRLQQVTCGYVPDVETGQIVEVGSSKIKALRETLEDVLAGGGKVVVFHRFTRDGEQIRKLAEEVSGSAPAFIYGGVPSVERGEHIRRFQEDEDCRVFVAQIQASGLGVTLTAANVSIFYSVGYSGGDYEQAKGRIHRISQTSKCTHIHLVAKGTVDEHVLDALESKRRIADDLSDGAWARYIRGS